MKNAWFVVKHLKSGRGVYNPRLKHVVRGSRVDGLEKAMAKISLGSGVVERKAHRKALQFKL